MRKMTLNLALVQVVLFAGLELLLASCATNKIESRGTELSTTSQPTASSPLPVTTVKSPVKRPLSLKPDQTSLSDSSNFQLPDPASTVFFSPGSTAISKDSFAVINAFAKKLNDDSRSTVLLIGHADDQTGKEYSIALSGKRITVVEDELIKHGVRQTQIRERPLGNESSIPKDCASKLCRQANRSVELRLSE